MSDEPPDPLGFFAGAEKQARSPARSRSRGSRNQPREASPRNGERSKALSRSPPEAKRRRGSPSSSGSGGEDDGDEARLRRLRKRISKFVDKNRLDNRVSGIMQNMHPIDVEQVMGVPFPEDCRNPSGFVVSKIREAERDNMRPKNYRWDGKNWDRAPVAKPGGSPDRSRGGGGRDRSRSARFSRKDRNVQRRGADRCGARGRGRERRPRHAKGRRDRRPRRAGDSRDASEDDSYSASYYSDAAAGGDSSRSRPPRGRRRR